MDNKEIKQKSSQAVGYQGNVTIKLIKNGKVKKTIKQHNEGKLKLFQALAFAVCGNLSQQDLPNYIDLVYYDSQSQSSTSILSYKPSLTGRTPQMVGADAYEAIFTAYVPATAIATSDKKYNVLNLLCNTDSTSILATLTLDEIQPIPDDYTLMVQWAMVFTNTAIDEQPQQQNQGE